MSAPEPPADTPESWPPTPRHYWQMRHDVDDVYDLVGRVERKVDAVAAVQSEQSGQLIGIQQTLREHDARFDAVDARFDRVEGQFTEVRGQLAEVRGQLAEVRGQLAEVLRAVRPEPPAG
jgi:septal ring factor EnvC (AmiA/AmiB activator)